MFGPQSGPFRTIPNRSGQRNLTAVVLTGLLALARFLLSAFPRQRPHLLPLPSWHSYTSIMDRSQVAEILENIGMLLELKGENPFKTRAYTNAARALEALSEPLEKRIPEQRLA